MSVSQARRAAFDTWELINHGKSPIEERRKEKLEKQLVIEQARKDALSQVQTFEKVALEWVDD